MTGAEFRAALTEAGFTMASFGRFLAEHGDPALDITRKVEWWCKNQPSGYGIVALNLVRLAQEGRPPLQPLGDWWI